ncbi:MAG TPA: glycosyltransferase family 4 protein [Geminicoccus sp.]|jgi:glycosyltransferase involved in cell wall biosynthesis|uniref:glycosyltransferase family 4 protein n=1 Tax=Geminicoccus sp. TaxID=2024832 RepID=UPI002E2F77A4|nr:glycosyltransferase family 4 protein [Geminicoccus sp.]HEX2527380.1 glycosyltransferase family 4 protein [Geminicoccus sp.]
MIRPRALVVAPQPFFTPRGTPFSVYYRTLVTAEEGFDVDLLCYGQGEDIDLPNVRTYRIPALSFLGPVKIGPSGLKLFLDAFMVFWTLGLLCTRRYQFVHAHEESVFFLRFLKPIFGFRLIYDMHSCLPEQLRNYKFTESKAIIGIFEWLERTCLKNADAVITICPELARYAEPLVPDRSRHVLIENSIFDEVQLARRTRDVAGPVSADLPAGRKPVVYAGTLEAYQGIDILLGGFAAALPRAKDALLVVVGGTDEQVEHYREKAAGLGIADDVIFIGRVPQPVAKAYIRQAHVLVSPRSAGINTPLKIYEQLASGIPLVATNILSHTQVLDERICFLCDPNPSAFGEALVTAITDDEARTLVSEGAQRRYADAYSRPIYVGKMRRVLDMVFPERSREICVESQAS